MRISDEKIAAYFEGDAFCEMGDAMRDLRDSRAHYQNLCGAAFAWELGLREARAERDRLRAELVEANQDLLAASASERDDGWLVVANSTARGAAEFLVERGLLEKHPKMDWVRSKVQP